MRMKKFVCIFLLLSALNLFGGEIVNLWNNVPETTAKEAAEMQKAKAAKKFVVEIPTQAAATTIWRMIKRAQKLPNF